MGDPSTPAGSKRSRQIVIFDEDCSMSVPTPPPPAPEPQRSRSIRRRGLSAPAHDAHDGLVPPDLYEFLVYLPNSSSVSVRVDAVSCQSLTVDEFMQLVRSEHRLKADPHAKQKQREVMWEAGVYITDFQGNLVTDGRDVFVLLREEFKAGRGLLLHDNHPNIVHSHWDFWNVTPETHLLQILPQDYSVFSALADELDNSLQAVYQLGSGPPLICLDLDNNLGTISLYDTGKGMDSTPQNSISKWGTMGSSMYRRLVNEAIGIPPPYLKPNFGMFGLGGIGAGLHLGGCITVSSKTKTSPRVAVLHLAKESLEANVKAGSVWKTGGEFRPPTEQELQWSPHGSFTKVEISKLNPEIRTWRVEDVQRKLKDFYFPYIQNDDGAGGLTSRPVEIRVNGEDLAGVVGGEVALTNYFSGVGEPYVLLLEFLKSAPGVVLTLKHAGGGVDKANARITCHYFPINKGREAIDEILERLKEEDPRFVEPGVVDEVNFDNYSRRSIRRLGRLLPRARGGRLPFMEPKRFHREQEVSRHCFKRAKAFIDVDAGFVPTHSKTDLDPNHAFTEALLKLGSGLQTVDSSRGIVAVTITRNGTVMRPEHLHTDYKMWITKNHEKLDVGAIINKHSPVIVTKQHHKDELSIKAEVFRVVYDMKCGEVNWMVGKTVAPVRLKLSKGLPSLSYNDPLSYVTVECFISDGLAEQPDQTRGETRIICRPLGIPEERGSKETLDQNLQHTFILGESRVLPVEILYSSKCMVVDETKWHKQEEKAQRKAPAFVEILNKEESFPVHANLRAGAILPPEVIAVVRPNIWKDHMAGKGKAVVDSMRSQQKYIFPESMEMKLVVGKMKYQPPEVSFSKAQIVDKVTNAFLPGVERTFERKVASSTGSPLKGLYFFNTTGSEFEQITRKVGTHFLLFTLVSDQYQDVDATMVRINVSPSYQIGNWTICSHPGDCTQYHDKHSPKKVNVRIGGALSSTLFLRRFDKFGNPWGFQSIPLDIQCDILSKDDRKLLPISTLVPNDLLKIADEDHFTLEIPVIKIGEGNLEPLKPTMEAALRLIVDGRPVGVFPISVFSGGVASACMKESEALDKGLHPGQIIEKIIFEVMDSHQNLVSAGEQVKVVLDGFAFQDKVGHLRRADGTGCLDLSMRLRVTASYGEEACLELLSTEDLTIWKQSFRVVIRMLQIRNVLNNPQVGSLLTGVQIEAVDVNGKVDQTMDGAAHSLTLDWNPNISIPLCRGVCTIPPIPMRRSVMEDGCVTHAQHPKLKLTIPFFVDVRPPKEEYLLLDSQNPQASSHAGPLSPIAWLDHYEPKPLALRDGQIPSEAYKLALVLSSDVQAPSDEHRLALQVALKSTLEKSKRLESKLQRLGRKLKKQEDDLGMLGEMKEEYEKSMKRYQGDLTTLMAANPGKFKSSGSGKPKVTESEKLMPCEDDSTQIELHSPIMAGDDQLEACNTSAEGTLGCGTPEQVEMQIAHLGNPCGTHAAAILLRAQRQLDRTIIMDDVIGVVALLGAVEDAKSNRALSAFLGSENMLAIICRTTGAAECFGVVNQDGSMDPNQGLYGLAHSRNLSISERIRVITLADESSFYKRDDGRPSVISTDPQKRLNMKPRIIPSSPASVGSLGYAVNLIQLNEDQLRIRIAGRYGLRESLFFVLFGFLEVFDTTSNMLRARKEIKSAAVSVDGAIIRTSNQFEWGARVDPSVCFPAWVAAAGQPTYSMRNLGVGAAAAPSAAEAPRRFIPFKEARPVQHKQRKELMKAMEATHQRYTDKGVEKSIEKTVERMKKTKTKIEGVTQLMDENNEEGLSLSRQVKAKKSLH